MADGSLKPASAIEVGDVLLSMDIEEIPSEGFDPSSWSTDSITINEYTETTVISVRSREVDRVVSINGDTFSISHYILTRKNGVIEFKNAPDIDTTYQIWSRVENDWQQVEVAEELEMIDTVYSINCEPFDKFFTENLLVYDVRD